MIGLAIHQELVGTLRLHASVFDCEARRIRIPVNGIIGNSVPDSPVGKANLLAWKRIVAAAAKTARSGDPLNQRSVYAVSVGFSFHLPSHGNQRLDIENFLKPTFDAPRSGDVLPELGRY